MCGCGCVRECVCEVCVRPNRLEVLRCDGLAPAEALRDGCGQHLVQQALEAAVR